MCCWVLRGRIEPEFGANPNKVPFVVSAATATAATAAVAPLARPEELEPVVSSKYVVAAPTPAPLDAAATAAKTGRAGEIICPVMICGICVYLFTRIKWRTSRNNALHE